MEGIFEYLVLSFICNNQRGFLKNCLAIRAKYGEHLGFPVDYFEDKIIRPYKNYLVLYKPSIILWKYINLLSKKLKCMAKSSFYIIYW